MSDIDVPALRAAAEGATPGPWEMGLGMPCQRRNYFVSDAVRDIATANSAHRNARRNATYIAAANPVVVLELLDRLERLEAACITIPAEQFKRLTADDEEQP